MNTRTIANLAAERAALFTQAETSADPEADRLHEAVGRIEAAMIWQPARDLTDVAAKLKVLHDLLDVLDVGGFPRTILRAVANDLAALAGTGSA